MRGSENPGILGDFANDALAQAFATLQNWLYPGVLYYNTTLGNHRYWNGAAWVGMGGGTLNDAYNFGGPGAGRIITVDSNAVALNNLIANDTHALNINRSNSVDVMGMTTGSAINIGFNVGPMNIGVLASSILNTIADNAGALGGTITGETILISGTSGSLAQKQGIRMVITGDMDNGLDDEGIAITAAHTMNHATQAFYAYYGDMQSITTTLYSAIYGLNLLMPDDSWAVNNPIRGIQVTMPGWYSGTDMAGAEFTGTGMVVKVCGTDAFGIPYGIQNTDTGTGVVSLVNSGSSGMEVQFPAGNAGNLFYANCSDPATNSRILFGSNCRIAAAPGEFIRGLYVDLSIDADSTATFLLTDTNMVIRATSNNTFYGHRITIQPGSSITAQQAIYGFVFQPQTLTINDASTPLYGSHFDFSSITATNYSLIYGINVQMPDDVNGVGNPIRGIRIEMPNAYSGGDMAGIVVTGDGRYVAICNDDYAIQVNGDVYIAGREIISYPIVGALSALDITRTGGTGPGIYVVNATAIVEIGKTAYVMETKRAETVDTTSVQNLLISTSWNTVGMPDLRWINGIMNRTTFSGNLTGTNRCYISGLLNETIITSTSGRIYSGDLAQANHEAIYSYKTIYSPVGGATGRPGYLCNFRAHYQHYGNSSATTTNIIGCDIRNEFGAYNYTVTTLHGMRVQTIFANVPSGTSPITNLFGIQLLQSAPGTNVVITNNYGLYIQTHFGGTNNWSLYIVGGLSYFGGAIQANSTVDMTGGANMWFRPPSMTTAQRNAMTAAWGAGDAGKSWFNTTTSQFEGWNGAAIVILG